MIKIVEIELDIVIDIVLVVEFMDGVDLGFYMGTRKMDGGKS